MGTKYWDMTSRMEEEVAKNPSRLKAIMADPKSNEKFNVEMVCHSALGRDPMLIRDIADPPHMAKMSAYRFNPASVAHMVVDRDLAAAIMVDGRADLLINARMDAGAQSEVFNRSPATAAKCVNIDKSLKLQALVKTS